MLIIFTVRSRQVLTDSAALTLKYGKGGDRIERRADMEKVLVVYVVSNECEASIL